MFQLSLVDHIRLSFGTVVRAYEGHTEAAVRLARWSWHARLATASLLGISVATSIAAAMRGGVFILAAPVPAGVAFATFAVYVAMGFDARVSAHRSTAARLWLVCEKYRAFLAEIHDRLIEVPAMVERRNALLQEAAEIFGHAPPGDRATFDIGRTLLGGDRRGYSDEQLDQFLPVSMRRAAGA